ncbi:MULTISPECIES: hypothetical protein [Marinovum]|uniref:hypothetical protein n=1 Tax=Marinovum TaxID=367771 RepID=UPI00237A9BFB|nr:hypothetical protein [Marinovum sp. PR37]MDD9745518.1 hypothetical protein [Marinovum sp. PR37]
MAGSQYTSRPALPKELPSSAPRRGEPEFPGTEQLRELAQSPQAECAGHKQDQGYFNASLELEGRIQDIANLSQALDLVIGEISVSSISDPLPERTRRALLAIHEALLVKATETEEFLEKHWDDVRRGAVAGG